jgi:hypothetical protein
MQQQTACKREGWSNQIAGDEIGHGEIGRSLA